MKTLAIALLVLACVGCGSVVNPKGSGLCGDRLIDVGEECDDGNSASGDGCSATCKNENPNATATIAATWSLVNADGTETSCPAGFGTAQLRSQRVDENGEAVGAPVVDLFECSAKVGRSSALPPGRYDTVVVISNASGANTYATSIPESLDLSSVDGLYATAIVNDGGYVTLSWELIGESTNKPLTCEDAGAVTVEALLTEAGASIGVPASFGCTDGGGFSMPLRAGTYAISISALDGTGGSLGSAAALTNRVVPDRNGVEPLGTITIAIAGM